MLTVKMIIELKVEGEPTSDFTTVDYGDRIGDAILQYANEVGLTPDEEEDLAVKSVSITTMDGSSIRQFFL